MPVALISTRTSPAFGPSRSSSTISSGFLASKATAARVFISVSPQQMLARADLLPAHAGVFRPRIGLRLVFFLGGADASGRVIGAGAQVNIEVVHVAGDAGVVAERRHDVLLRAADVLAAAGDDAKEVGIAHGLGRGLQGRGVGRTHSVGPMADVTLTVIAAVAGISIPVHGAVGRDLEG